MRFVVVGALLLAACAAPPSAGPGQVVVTDGAGNIVDDDKPVGRLTDLPPCDGPPTPGPDPAPEDLFLPAGTVVEAVTSQAQVVSLEAWAPLTPSQVRRAFEQATGYEVVTSEDETYDAEVLVTTGDDRTFVEILAVCNRASRFVVVTSTERDG